MLDNRSVVSNKMKSEKLKINESDSNSLLVGHLLLQPGNDLDNFHGQSIVD